MLTDKEAFSEEKIVATESALGALGKMIYFQRDNNFINDKIVTNTFLKNLPLKNEEEEACKSHQLFFE